MPLGLPEAPLDEPWTLTARWVFPVDRPPLARGTVTIQGERIIAVDAKGGRAPDIDLGNVAVIPGLVNAHTHLDLSDALGKCPPTPDFIAWLRGVIDHRRGQTPADVSRAIETGLAQCLRHGTTLVGDIAAAGKSWDYLAHAPMQAVVFYELLGLTAERAEAAVNQAASWLKTHSQTGTCFAGLAPHAPYSVRHSLLAAAAGLSSDAAAQSRLVPVAIHLAETSAEPVLLKTHAGPFEAFLKEMEVWDPNGLVADVDAVLQLGSLNGWIQPNLYVHCNYLKDPPSNGSVVYCPRTHAAFGHPSHPWKAFLAKGACVALGTDSLASNPDLDVLAEARFLHQREPEVPGSMLLEMATRNGAKALGLDCRTGTLSPGKWADLAILPLPDAYEADPHRLIFESDLPIKATLFRGRERRTEFIPFRIQSE